MVKNLMDKKAYQRSKIMVVLLMVFMIVILAIAALLIIANYYKGFGDGFSHWQF